MGVAALRIVNLSKRYGRLLALDDLTLDVPAGEVFGFLGPNGAGKSTTIRLLLGLARPTSGRAWIFDGDAADVAAAHRLMAYVPADVALWPRMTGAEVLDLLGRIGPGIDAAYRDELVERFALDVSKPAGTYSTGNRQKVALVEAFATRARLLVLDEPTSGLDPLMEWEFRRAVAAARDNGQTVVEVASVAQLRVLHRTEVAATFVGTPPDLTGIAGVEGLRADGSAGVRFTLNGSPAAALRALADAGVATIAVRDPSLEEGMGRPTRPIRPPLRRRRRRNPHPETAARPHRLATPPALVGRKPRLNTTRSSTEPNFMSDDTSGRGARGTIIPCTGDGNLAHWPRQVRR